jgi:hypothetical protein
MPKNIAKTNRTITVRSNTVRSNTVRSNTVRSQQSFSIERGVPFPSYTFPVQLTYPFADMLPGDSFLIPVPSMATKADVGRLRSTFYAALKRAQKARVATGSFTTRRVENGVRVWRVK